MTHDHDRGEHWADNPADDFAWNAYAAGWDRAVADVAAGQRTMTGGASLPFVEGYADGWETATERKHTMTEQELDAIWQSLTPAAKASWVQAMQPEPPGDEPILSCGMPACDICSDDYDPADPGFTPDPERCVATGGDHVWSDNLTPAQILTGLRPRSGVLVWCEECGATAAIDPEDR